MPKYLISYDLRKVRNYDALTKILRDWKCISPLKSLWLGTLTGPAETIRDLLTAQMDSNDGILVVELTAGADWAVYKVNENAPAWLKANVSP